MRIATAIAAMTGIPAAKPAAANHRPLPNRNVDRIMATDFRNSSVTFAAAIEWNDLIFGTNSALWGGGFV